MSRPVYSSWCLDKENGWIGGVCSGISRVTRADATAIRIGFVLAALLLPKLTIAGYLLAWLLMNPGNNSRA